MGARSRIVLLVVVLLVSGFMGLMVAMAFAPGDQQSGQLVKRVRDGVTETGRLETVTSNGDDIFSRLNVGERSNH